MTLQISFANDSIKTWTVWAEEAKGFAKGGNYQEEVHALREALATAISSNVDDRELVSVLISLGAAFADTGDYVGTEHEWRHALVIVERNEGRESLDFALLLGDVCLLPTQTGNYEETTTTIRKAIALHRQTDSTALLADVQIRLTKLLVEQKRYGEAEAAFLDSQATLARVKTPSHRQVAEAFIYVSSLRYAQGRFAESAEVNRKLIHLLETDWGTEHPVLLVPLNNLATVLVKTGLISEAQAAYERAIGICEKTASSSHPDYVTLLRNYSFVLRKLGRKKEAKEMAARSHRLEMASFRRNGVGFTVSVDALRSKQE